MKLKNVEFCPFCHHTEHNYVSGHSYIEHQTRFGNRLMVIKLDHFLRKNDLNTEINKDLFICIYDTFVSIEPNQDIIISKLLEFDKDKEFKSFKELNNLILEKVKLYLVFQ